MSAGLDLRVIPRSVCDILVVFMLVSARNRDILVVYMLVSA